MSKNTHPPQKHPPVAFPMLFFWVGLSRVVLILNLVRYSHASLERNTESNMSCDKPRVELCTGSCD
jgi:hypothetical protein